MHIDNGDLSLHVTDEGVPDGPPVLLLHGITSCVHTWDWLVPVLAGRHRVVRLDFRGHGGSGRAPGAYQFADYVSDAAAVCDQVIGQPCVIVGHSLGGGTAAALAQQRPELVAGVVLEDPALASAGDVMEGNALLEAFTLMRQSVPMLQQQPGLTVEALAAMLAGMPSTKGVSFGELLHPDAVAAMAAGLLALDATVLDPVIERTMEPAFDATAAIPVRGLVLAADPAQPDAVVRQVQRDRLAATSPLVEVRVVAGAGHLIHDELAHRDTMRDAVLQFLAG